MQKNEVATVSELLNSIKEIEPEKLCSLILALADNDPKPFREVTPFEDVSID